ncbi:MAG: recombinase family protein, partial [Oscillospiraceae bacterium]|nr:recombinase family protein [Oscillospiraceae bacterium]
MELVLQQRTVREIPALPKLLHREYRQLRTTAYCRVSTKADEQHLSYENQCAFYTDHIQQNPEWRFAGIFADEGITGTSTKNRHGFNRMIRQCKAGKIDLIITKSISRFARNTVDTLNTVRELKAMGIGVIFEKENIDTRKASNEFLLTVFAGLAQAESESISQNVRWGKQKRAAQGNVCIAYGSFLGYTKGENGPEIVPDEAETVREIYARFLAGDSFNTIATVLEQQGRKTARGGESWSSTSIRSILRNEKYKGDALLQKTYIEDCISKRIRVNRGELPQYYVENSHPAIIERKVWDRTQEELARRAGKRKVKEVGTKTEQGKYSSKYALTELLICGDCGTPYRRCTWSRNGKKKIVWRCINRLDYGTKYCKKSPTIEESALQNAILRAITNLATSEPLALDTLKLHIEMGLQDAPDETSSLRLRLNELNTHLIELVATNTAGGIDDTDNDA